MKGTIVDCSETRELWRTRLGLVPRAAASVALVSLVSPVPPARPEVLARAQLIVDVVLPVRCLFEDPSVENLTPVLHAQTPPLLSAPCALLAIHSASLP